MAKVVIDDAAIHKLIADGPVSLWMGNIAHEMVDHLKATAIITGDREPPRSYGKSKNKGHGYFHNVGGYSVMIGRQDNGLPVTWVVSSNHFTMLEFGSFNGKQPARHYLSTTLLLFRV